MPRRMIPTPEDVSIKVDEIVENSESNSQSCYNTGNYIWIFVIIVILFIFGGFHF